MSGYLDLTKDRPDGYEGRRVSCDGAEYVIGRRVRESRERIVHELTNCRTGLTLHQIGIPRDQVNAAENSTRRARKLAELRDLGIEDTPEPRVVRAHGGHFEIDEVPTLDHASATRYEQAVRAARQGRWTECRALSEQILADTPNHTPALDLLACSYGETGDYMSAIVREVTAMEDEPNFRPVRHNLLRYAAAEGAIALFTEQFDDLKRAWPADNELDGLAAEIFLAAGRPDIAAGLRVPPAEAELVGRIHGEARRRERARALMLAGRRDHAQALGALEQAYAEYDKDVEIAFNWGHLLLRHGDWRRAHEALGRIIPFVSGAVRTQCLGSIAFALATGGEYEAAAAHLMAVSRWLTDLSGGGPPGVVDLPFWAAWLENDQVLADRSMEQPYLLVDRIIRGLQASGAGDPAWLPALGHIRGEYQRGLDG